MEIRDPQTLVGAGVNAAGQLSVSALTPLQAAARNGDAYAFDNVTYDYAAADTVIAVRNDSTVARLVVDEIVIWGDTETNVVIHVIKYAYTPTGTAITGTNLKTDSGNTADASAIGDETGAATQGTIVQAIRINDDERAYVKELNVVLGTNHAIGVDFVTDGGEAEVTVFGHFEAN